MKRLLHVAVSDVNDDVRRAAVTCLGLVLVRSPEQVGAGRRATGCLAGLPRCLANDGASVPACFQLPSLVSLLSERQP